MRTLCTIALLLGLAGCADDTPAVTDPSPDETRAVKDAGEMIASPTPTPAITASPGPSTLEPVRPVITSAPADQ